MSAPVQTFTSTLAPLTLCAELVLLSIDVDGRLSRSLVVLAQSSPVSAGVPVNGTNLRYGVRFIKSDGEIVLLAVLWDTRDDARRWVPGIVLFGFEWDGVVGIKCGNDGVPFGFSFAEFFGGFGYEYYGPGKPYHFHPIGERLQHVIVELESVGGAG